MRVVVLGGAGEVGAEVTRDLARVDEIDSLVIADVDERRAAELAGELERPEVAALEVDVRDRDGALAALTGADLLMNCTSFALFDDVFALALAAGVDYADLISEPSERQREAARDAGITAISGLGATPGLSNVLVAPCRRRARRGTRRRDLVAQLANGGADPRSARHDPVGELGGLPDAGLLPRWSSAPRGVHGGFADGRVRTAARATVRLLRAAPRGHDASRATYQTCASCAVRGSWRPELMQDMRVLERYGLLAADALEATKRAIWERCGGVRDGRAWMLYVNVEIGGTRDGSRVKRTYKVSHPVDWGERGVARMTGIPAAVGAQLLARHGRIATGFVDPEEYYDPLEFLAELECRHAVVIDRDEVELPAAREQTPA